VLPVLQSEIDCDRAGPIDNKMVAVPFRHHAWPVNPAVFKPAAQGVHNKDPKGLNVFTAQAVHEDIPKNPALHLQSDDAVDPGNEINGLVHAVHV
jgi:hypothetical protein